MSTSYYHIIIILSSSYYHYPILIIPSPSYHHHIIILLSSSSHRHPIIIIPSPFYHHHIIIILRSPYHHPSMKKTVIYSEERLKNTYIQTAEYTSTGLLLPSKASHTQHIAHSTIILSSYHPLIVILSSSYHHNPIIILISSYHPIIIVSSSIINNLGSMFQLEIQVDIGYMMQTLVRHFVNSIQHNNLTIGTYQVH